MKKKNLEAKLGSTMVVKTKSNKSSVFKQGTTIIPNLSSVLTDKDQWKFPHEFNPENFLNDKGEFLKPDAFIPFSVGKRKYK